ncbi:putative transcription factor C2H2 family [Helianthus annuus]|uniref:RING-type E3 ubiquitin transferase n=1 Tax=Helianthus annuus TaxID=4232 RepID=A0A251SHI9_HELAN|nr:RING-H2 finger protein ATL80 [Helianthus annuus]KAF5769103.1 putative transcription factor C2H2 family [Helianthus annuus]KAJ0464194.1 putative transcription factor C2H2 family [Helianthus annuus]KAJ0468629.1 putative transcription factor C2H2 family [Helianthus annuus]KAJ0485768.1 putative transcription factor C2H2 family [Helianthus annuus]KAJ0656320.1 putative transcription factor C2H2 family [Helianthus annuus]
MTRHYRFLSSVANSSSLDQTAAQPPEAVIVESDFVVILAALLCALICILGLLAVARCAWLRRGTTSTVRRNPSQPAANKGMKKKVIESLPKFVYNSGKEEIGGKKVSSGECAICLAEYSDGDEVRVLPQCGHGFHVGCIDVWLNSHSSCPSCRQMLVVTRCRKCGEFPSGVAGESSREMERKGGRHDNTSCESDYLP